MSRSRYAKSLTEVPSAVPAERGVHQHLTAEHFPVLKGLSITRTVLAARTAREPHWWAEGRELGYCVRGRAVVTIAGNNADVHRFVLETGQMYFAPEAVLITVENLGDDVCEIVAAVSHEQPADFGISESMAFMTDAVIGNTFGLSAEAVADRRTVDSVLLPLDGEVPVAQTEQLADPYWFDVEHAPFVGSMDVAGGAFEAKKMYWPALEGVSMFSLYVTDDGMREAHWHPVTAEMGYVVAGHGRMSILDPDGSWDTYELQPGDVYFVPRSYPHMIEDIGDDDIHFLVFFDRETSGDIGYKVAFAGLDPAVAAATFGLPVDRLPELTATRTDPQFVRKINPTDPAEPED